MSDVLRNLNTSTFSVYMCISIATYYKYTSVEGIIIHSSKIHL